MPEQVFYIEHPEKGIFYGDSAARDASHCLMSKELATAMAKDMQYYPETRGAVVVEADPEFIELRGWKLFILG